MTFLDLNFAFKEIFISNSAVYPYLKKVMKSHLEAHKLISIEQHGFVSSKSCVTNLLECQDIKTSALHKRLNQDVLYTDFMKAFDKVSHRKLLHKLRAYGFGERLVA